jgi:pimeloyl-ACP methyl ester carboxylesterase
MIYTNTVQTSRLRVHYRTNASTTGVPVLLIHGNVSSSVFFETLIDALPEDYYVVAPDLRGYGETEALPLDATRGLKDWADDVHAFVEALGWQHFHLLGWSLGAGVAMQYAIDHSERLLSLTLESAMSPYGFGGTKDADGTPTFADYAGSGGGTANPEFTQRLAAGDTSNEDPNSPRAVMNTFYFKPPFRVSQEREDTFVSGMLSTKTGEGFYPGDLTISENWPTLAPGTKGINNAISPKYCNLKGFANITHKPRVLWIRGADDQIVSDTSLFDFGYLGTLGFVPNYPGEKQYPPQPMVSQLRAVLDSYQRHGGVYQEKLLPDCGHSPHIERENEFVSLLKEHLQGSHAI